MSAEAQEQGSDWGDVGPSAGVEALAAAHALARQRADGGDLTGARTMIEDALAAGELRLGRDHPRLVPLMLDLSTIAHNVGNLTEAQIQLRRAYGIAVATTGPDHPTAVSIEGRLATICQRLGEPTDAYDWHITDVGPRVLGAEHPAVRGAQKRLAATPQRRPEPDGGGWAPASYEDDELGYASTYTPSPRHPGVFQRRAAEEMGMAAPRERPEPPGPVPYQSGRARRGHGAGIALVASLGLAIIVAAVVIAVQLFGPNPNTVAGPATTRHTGAAPTSTPTSQPPTDVTLVDNGGSVTLTWLDPSAGAVPFIVAGGRVGATSAPLESVPAGRTTSTIYGLNDRYNYCFTVAAVWSSERIETSVRACTDRLSTSATLSVPITPSTT